MKAPRPIPGYAKQPLHPLLRIYAVGLALTQRRYRRSRWPVAGTRELPPLTTYDRQTPLVDLPILSLDTEATGIDPQHDRIVSIAAVNLSSGRLHLGLMLDMLVNPRRAIPSNVTRIHGITDRHVRNAPHFVDLAGMLEKRLGGYVLLGHNIHFDAALLHHEMRRAGRDWQMPPLLDTMLLFAALYPQAETLSLDHVAKRLRISLIGRHTARGDALIALDLYYRLLPHLAARDILTLGRAEEASAAALARLRRRHRDLNSDAYDL
ncbi:3'-5' exonuclease [Dongia soli]|uniref:DNA-directed DNA polymerase n=1 Tax=Dongia soli TaxID=600628 RepID=A0ABU5EGW4_9PROT|nr:3'-5' exonuclease [Dongia soli]MDY0885114.1 3'-5' exonuclease [Dongia soli]